MPLVGEPLAKRESFAVCQSLPSVGEVASRSDDGEAFTRKPPLPNGRGGFLITYAFANSPFSASGVTIEDTTMSRMTAVK